MVRSIAMRALDFIRSREPVGASDVRELEARFKVMFPDDFVEFFSFFHGSTPRQTDFQIEDANPRKRHVAVGEFLSVIPGKLAPPTIAEVAEWVSSDLPAGLVPFANTGGGDLICLDYRHGPTPNIAYSHHGRGGGKDEVTTAAASFTSFLEMLNVPA